MKTLIKQVTTEQANIIKAVKEKLDFINGYNLYCKKGLSANIKKLNSIERTGFNFSILANSKK